MNYPKRIIKKGEADKTIVKIIQAKLNEICCGPIIVDGAFEGKTISAVKLFQSTRKDKNGNSLIADGKIGAITWESLFGSKTVFQNTTTSSDFLSTLIDKAKLE